MQDIVRQAQQVADLAAKVDGAEPVAGKMCYRVSLLPSADGRMEWFDMDSSLLVKKAWWELSTSGPVLVQQVVEGSAAEKAGLKAGDVISAVAGQAVKSGAELRNRIGLMRVGETVEITYFRDGKLHRASAVVSAKGAAPGEDSPAADLHRAFEGADLGDAANGGGVLVRSVEAESPAAQAGLRTSQLAC